MNEELNVLRCSFSAHVPGLLGAQQAYAVLCPFAQYADGLHLLFEVRSAGIRQGGEVCFPGGKVEDKESWLECALRETREELSIPEKEVEFLGLGDFICNQRGFILQPVLGLVSPAGLQAVRPAAAEVAEVFSVPVSFFRSTVPEFYHYDLLPQPPEEFPYAQVGIPSSYAWAKGRVEVPVWYYQGHAIWGMTARIVRSVTSVLPEER